MSNAPNSDLKTNALNESSGATQLRNFVIALVAIALTVSVFLGVRTKTESVSLAAMAQAAVPLDVALRNEQPSVIEFYADWCTTCQSMAADMDHLKQTYGDRINFVMLNVDNTKWLPEMLHYRVDGIPHFIFLDDQGEAIADAIGKQPETIMAANLDALTRHDPLPYANRQGQISTITAPTEASTNDDPRSHGGV